MRDLDGAALIAVDLQRGFISEVRELPVPEGAQVVPIINRLLLMFPIRVASQDWHPAGHGSFASAHAGARPFDIGELAGAPQVLWPDHCVQGTAGAEFHPAFDHRLVQAVFRKGSDPGIDSYSVFRDNSGRNPTGLDGYLRSRGARSIYLAGLALDYCVRYTARDARLLLPDLPITVIKDACRPVAVTSGEETQEELRALGVELLDSRHLLG